MTTNWVTEPRSDYDSCEYWEMTADREIRILAQLLEIKTELQEQALSRTGASKRMCLAQIKGIDKGIEIVRKELEND